MMTYSVAQQNQDIRHAQAKEQQQQQEQGAEKSHARRHEPGIVFQATVPLPQRLPPTHPLPLLLPPTRPLSQHLQLPPLPLHTAIMHRKSMEWTPRPRRPRIHRIAPRRRRLHIRHPLRHVHTPNHPRDDPRRAAHRQRIGKYFFSLHSSVFIFLFYFIYIYILIFFSDMT